MNPGDRYTVIDADGTQHDDIVHSVRYRSEEPEIRQHPTGWRRVIRSLTPHRWRKPLPIARPYRPAAFEIVGVSEVERRMKWTLDDLTTSLNIVLGIGELPWKEGT